MGEVKPAKVENYSTGNDANTLFADGKPRSSAQS